MNALRCSGFISNTQKNDLFRDQSLVVPPVPCNKEAWTRTGEHVYCALLRFIRLLHTCSVKAGNTGRRTLKRVQEQIKVQKLKKTFHVFSCNRCSRNFPPTYFRSCWLRASCRNNSQNSTGNCHVRSYLELRVSFVFHLVFATVSM